MTVTLKRCPRDSRTEQTQQHATELHDTASVVPPLFSRQAGAAMLIRQQHVTSPKAVRKVHSKTKIYKPTGPRQPQKGPHLMLGIVYIEMMQRLCGKAAPGLSAVKAWLGFSPLVVVTAAAAGAEGVRACRGISCQMWMLHGGSCWNSLLGNCKGRRLQLSSFSCCLQAASSFSHPQAPTHAFILIHCFTPSHIHNPYPPVEHA